MSNLSTYIAMVVDRSGSMYSIAKDTIEGINSFITGQKEDPENVTFTYVQFDDFYEVVHDNVAMSKAPLVNDKTFKPRGMTALLDAIGTTINRTAAYIEAQAVQDRPEKVVLVIVTDGAENASRDFNPDQVKELVTSKQNNDDWQIIYLGANQNAIFQAKQFGIRGTTAMNYSPGTVGVSNAYAATCANVTSLKKGLYEGIKFDALQRSDSTGDSEELTQQAVAQYTAAGVDVSKNSATDKTSSGQTTS